MPEESHELRTLRAARAQAIQARRELATTLARSYEAGRTENMRKDFIQVQTLIEAIDSAIEDEESFELSDVLGHIPGAESGS